MCWQIVDQGGQLAVNPDGGSGCATDGDMDAAYALLLAGEACARCHPARRARPAPAQPCCRQALEPARPGSQGRAPVRPAVAALHEQHNGGAPDRRLGGRARGVLRPLPRRCLLLGHARLGLLPVPLRAVRTGAAPPPAGTAVTCSVPAYSAGCATGLHTHGPALLAQEQCIKTAALAAPVLAAVCRTHRSPGSGRRPRALPASRRLLARPMRSLCSSPSQARWSRSGGHREDGAVAARAGLLRVSPGQRAVTPGHRPRARLCAVGPPGAGVPACAGAPAGEGPGRRLWLEQLQARRPAAARMPRRPLQPVQERPGQPSLALPAGPAAGWPTNPTAVARQNLWLLLTSSLRVRCRLPWRLAAYHAHSKDTRVEAVLARQRRFFASQQQVVCGYTLDGQPLESFTGVSFLAPAWCLFQVRTEHGSRPELAEGHCRSDVGLHACVAAVSRAQQRLSVSQPMRACRCMGTPRRLPGCGARSSARSAVDGAITMETPSSCFASSRLLLRHRAGRAQCQCHLHAVGEDLPARRPACEASHGSAACRVPPMLTRRQHHHHVALFLRVDRLPRGLQHAWLWTSLTWQPDSAGNRAGHI